MVDIKTVQGVTNIYDSKEAQDFDKSNEFPIAWEVIFVNDEAGKEFAAKFAETASKLPKEKFRILNFDGSPSDIARSIECAFADKDCFSKAIRESLDNIIFYDEDNKKILPKQMMIDTAGKIATKELAIA